MKSIVRYLVIGAVVALIGLAAATPARAAEPVKIGLLVPLSGPRVQVGVEVKALVQMLADSINTMDSEVKLPFWDSDGLPNLGGAKVEIVIGDASSADISMIEAERLITEEGVVGICGNFSSASTKTTMVMAEKYGVILLSEGTSESLTEEGYEYFGRTYPGDDTFIRDTFEYIKWLNDNENAGIRKVALVCEDSEFGANIRQTEVKWAKHYGFEVIEDISYSATSSNVTSEVLRLKNVDADAVIMSSYITDALLFMSTFKEQNYFPKMLVGQRGGFVASDFLINLGSDADYCMTTARWNTDFKSDVSQRMAKAFREKYCPGVELTGDVVGVAWNFMVLSAIANQAGSTDVDAMRAEMLKGIAIKPEENPTGLPGFKYGENGQNIHTSAIVIMMKDGKYHTVYPHSVASTKGVYPAPNWSDR